MNTILNQWPVLGAGLCLGLMIGVGLHGAAGGGTPGDPRLCEAPAKAENPAALVRLKLEAGPNPARAGLVTALAPREALPPSRGASSLNSLLAAIAEVESGSSGGDAAYNPSEEARGRYQIRPAYWKDATEWLGVSWPHTDAHDPVKARAAVLAYWQRYRLLTDEDRARGHNGGGVNGPKIDATLVYWWKVQAVMGRGATVLNLSAAGM